MNKIILNIFILLTSTIGLTQNKTNTSDNVNPGEKSVITTKQQINQMHNSALLIRLKTRKNSIAALRKSGQNKKADKIESRQAEFNTKVINAFKTNFDFCPTYFFYSDYSQAIMDKKFEDVEFLNDSLQYDPNITFNNKSFLTAEFGLIEQDTARYFDGYYHTTSEGNGLEKRTKYNGGPNMSFRALIIKNEQFLQLGRPFPYYARTLSSLPIFKRQPKTVIKKMNDQLHSFYQSINN